MPMPRPSHQGNRILPIFAFVACFLAIGGSYWAIPYAKLSLPGPLIGPGLFLVFASAFLLRGPARAPFLAAFAAPALAAPAAVLARVGWEVAQDPTSHNLWPFEAVLAVLVGSGAALVGVLIGGVVLRLVPPRGRR